MQKEFPGTNIYEALTYKGFEFKVAHHDDNKFKAIIPSFAGGCELSGTRGKDVDETLIRTTSILNNAFIQPRVTKPRVGDLFGDDPDARLIIVAVGPEHSSIKLIPLKDAKVFRKVMVAEDKTVHPYLFVQNKVEDLSNEINLYFEKYVILEDGVLHTNNFPMDVFVWKGVKVEEVAE